MWESIVHSHWDKRVNILGGALDAEALVTRQVSCTTVWPACLALGLASRRSDAIVARRSTARQLALRQRCDWYLERLADCPVQSCLDWRRMTRHACTLSNGCGWLCQTPLPTSHVVSHPRARAGWTTEAPFACSHCN